MPARHSLLSRSPSNEAITLASGTRHSLFPLALEPLTTEARAVTVTPGVGALLLGQGQADIDLFEINDTTMNVLVQFADGLFDWCGPERPEDLWFETSEGDVLLGSIAHEEDAFMTLNDVEHEALRASGFPVQIFLTERTHPWGGV